MRTWKKKKKENHMNDRRFSKSGKVVFASFGGFSTVLDIWNIPTQDELFELGGLEFFNRYITSGASCYMLRTNLMPIIQVSKPPDFCITLHLFNRIPITDARKVNEIMVEAREHLQQMIYEKERRQSISAEDGSI
jgi:hypothetical protein